VSDYRKPGNRYLATSPANGRLMWGAINMSRPTWPLPVNSYVKILKGMSRCLRSSAGGDMRTGTANVLKGVIFGFLAGLLWLGEAPQARASALCPAAVTQPVVVAPTAGTPGTCTVTTTAPCTFNEVTGLVCPLPGGSACTGTPGAPGMCSVTSAPSNCSFNPAGTAAVCSLPRGSACMGVVLPGPAHVVNRTATGFKLQNGVCTNQGAGLDPSAFSGAALASQALSDLSQTTTQETSRNTINKMSERREAEQQRCAEGFTRVDGECQRIPSPAPEEKKVVEAKPAPEPSHKPKKAKKPKRAAILPEEQLPVAKAARRKKPQPKPRQVTVAPPPAMVCKDGPCAPIPVEPAVRFGTWTQVIGDYEHRDASSPAFVTADTGLLVPLGIGVQSRTGTVGFQAGGDFTTRGVLFPDDGLIVGAMAGFVSSKLTLNTSSLSGNLAIVNNGSGQMNANLLGPVAGLYASYFNNGFSTDLLLKVDVFNLNETFNDNLAFTSGGVLADGTFLPAFNFFASGSGSTSLLAATVFGDLNYRYIINPHFWIEPTVGAQYTNTSYGGGAANLGLEDGALVMVQGGARFGTDFFLGNGIHTTTILTGLAYDDVLVSGGFIPGAGFLGNNILAHADQGQVRGRGVLAFNFDFGQGISSFVQGEVRGGKGLFGAGGKAGVRVQW
jgi:hypothetical protein